ncbi:hypothetical protein PSTG_09337 [Puccinia striiformis f. sp. tritici PST-78]|uniref:Uncharacterized protein n=2 Tax=Puccinia striiformis f. sp. tritici TaxID=168172 RepID=A0A0L0VDJ0_9BASI|nr:hypothetical protein PSTG_09337 [Puccinia striiformis f. sp. tritici PST-78]
MEGWNSSANPYEASVLNTLDLLVHKYEESDYDNGFMTKEQNGLTHDELDERSKLVDKLQSSLVPSIKAQLVDFLASLNVQDYSKKKSDAGFKLILDKLLTLDLTMADTKECIQSATLLIPVDTYDHHLKVFKRFRMRRLVELASGLIESHIPKLFTNCMEMITGNLSTPARGIPRGQPGLPSDLRREVLRETRQCHVITNVIIGWSKISDLEVLKNAWVGGIESLSDIEITDEGGLLHLTIVGRTSQSAHGKLITELAQRTILLIKLMRVLWNKISEGSPTNPPFALDRELNSKTLSLLDNSPAYIVDRFGVVAQKLFGIHHDLDDDNGVVDDGWQIPFRFQINVISMEVESTLDPLGSHLVPSASAFDHPPLESDFKTWLSMWKGQWSTAKNQFLDLLSCSEGANL